jgi:hypothetical protein
MPRAAPVGLPFEPAGASAIEGDEQMTDDEVATLGELLMARHLFGDDKWMSAVDDAAVDCERLVQRGLAERCVCKECQDLHYRASSLAAEVWDQFTSSTARMN